MLHMLDTDTASYLIKGKSRAIEAKLAALAPSMVCISVMPRTGTPKSATNSSAWGNRSANWI